MDTYYALAIIDILMLMMLLYLIYTSTTINEHHVNNFCISIILVIICSSLEAFGWYLIEHQYFNLLFTEIFVIITSCIIAFLPYLIANSYFDSINRPKIKWGFILPSSICLIFLLNPWYHHMFTLANQTLIRGPLKPLSALNIIVGICYLIHAVIISLHKYQANERRFLFVFGFVSILGICFQFLNSNLRTGWTSITLSILVFYVFFHEFSIKNDCMTQLYNRQSFEKILEDVKFLQNKTLIVFDLDNFKQINDTLGHKSGDHYLLIFSSFLLKHFNHIGQCFRIGGDEFCIIIENQNLPLIEHQLQEVKEDIQQVQIIDQYMPNFSYGYAFFQPDLHPKKTFEEADMNMFKYKVQHKI